MWVTKYQWKWQIVLQSFWNKWLKRSEGQSLRPKDSAKPSERQSEVGVICYVTDGNMNRDMKVEILFVWHFKHE